MALRQVDRYAQPTFGISSRLMSEDTTAVQDPAPAASAPASDSSTETVNFTERYSEVLGKVNDTLDQVDWNQVGRIGKVV